MTGGDQQVTRVPCMAYRDIEMSMNTSCDSYTEVVIQIEIFDAFNWQKCNHNVVIIILPYTTLCSTVI
jgi:hypothetical protein